MQSGTSAFYLSMQYHCYNKVGIGMVVLSVVLQILRSVRKKKEHYTN